MACPKVQNYTPAGLQQRDYSRDLRPAKWGSTVILRSSNSANRMSQMDAAEL
jgi:hypothetical protein